MADENERSSDRPTDPVGADTVNSLPPLLLAYTSPTDERKSSMASFIGGILLGGALAYGSFVVGVLLVLGKYGLYTSPPASIQAIPFVGSAAVLAVGAVLAWRGQRRRPLGIGLLTSVPLVGLTMFVICGGLK